MIRTPALISTPFNNAPLYEFVHERLTIRGYSRAAQQTCWAFPELKIMFDQGFHSWDLATIPNLAITHGHPDHMGGLINYLSTRAMNRAPMTKVFVPSALETEVKNLLKIWREITGDDLMVDLIPCNPGDRISLGTKRFLVPFTLLVSVTLRK